MVATAPQIDAIDEAEAQIARWREECLQPTAAGFHRFCELVGRDDQGHVVAQDEIHRSWESHAQWCHARGLTPVVLAIWGHGKSVQRIAFRSAWMLAQDPDLRILCITNSDDTAKGRVRLVRDILESTMFQLLFPEIRIERSGDTTGIWLERRSSAADPSFRASTWSSRGTGVRCDVLLYDDVADMRNSVEVAAERPKVAEAMMGKWRNRLVPKREGDTRHWQGWHEQIGTRWHAEDWWAETLRSNTCCVLIQALDEANSKILCAVVGPSDRIERYPAAHKIIERDFDPKSMLNALPANDCQPVSGYEYGKAIGTISLWEAGGYTKDALDRLEHDGEGGPRWHDCGRRQRPFADSEVVCPHFSECYVPMPPMPKLPVGWLVAVGVDPGTATRRGTGIVVLAGDGASVRPLWVELDQLSSVETSHRITAVYERWHPEIIVVEDNAYQRSLREWGEEVGAPWVSVVQPFTTTGQRKYNPDTGVQALDVEFANHAWQIPELAWAGHPHACKCAWCMWRRQMVTTTLSDLKTKTGQIDLVMATWFARGGLRRFLRGGGVAFMGAGGDVVLDKEGRQVEVEAEDEEAREAKAEAAARAQRRQDARALWDTLGYPYEEDEGGEDEDEDDEDWWA